MSGVLRTFAALSIFGYAWISRAARAEDLAPIHEQVLAELAAMGRRGATTVRACESGLTILQTENGCSDWFENPCTDTAAVFRTRHYKLVES